MSNLESKEPGQPVPEIIPPRPEKKATIRLGQRELSRISAAVVLLIVFGLCFAGYRVFKNFKSQRDIVIAKTNLLALYKALSNYAQDWDGRLPPADHWTDAVSAYLSASAGTPGGKESYLHGPGDGPDIGYVYNELAAGYNLEPTEKENDRQLKIAPNRLVVLIEKPGAQWNEHVSIPAQGTSDGEAALYKMLAFPHDSEDPNNATTVLMLGNGTPDVKTRRDFRP